MFVLSSQLLKRRGTTCRDKGMLTLRPYQRAALDALYQYWEHQGCNGLIVLPTASGKSLVMAALCQELLKLYPKLRIGIVAHIKELIAQNYSELKTLWSEAPAGIYSAGLGCRDTDQRILFCGIQSVFDKLEQLGSFDLIIVDEAHLISKNFQTMYGKFFAAARQRMPDLRIVGLTASPWRLDSGRLDQGKDRIFDKIVYEINVKRLIDQDYLCPLISKATITALNVAGVRKRGGEFIPGELEAAVDKDPITRAAAKEIVQYGEGRRSWLVFCAGISHARHVCEELCALGVQASCVFGETSKAERDQLILDFRNSRIKCLVSVNTLGTGLNVPQVDLIALLRPTASAGLFLQQCGRGFRKAIGKSNCLILDFARNTARHGPVDTITASTAGKERGDNAPLVKECPQCASIIPLSSKECPDCGYVFPCALSTHEAAADSERHILSQAVWLNVRKMTCFKHIKTGSSPSLRVEYECGSLLVHKEWICLEHSGYARSKAEHWWQKAGGGSAPRNVDEALRRRNELIAPTQIKVRQVGKYFQVEERRYIGQDHPR